ncbi:DsbA family protein [Paracoccus sediminicola]|uniref:DsbA family protein n=1 Tax=Paracoccus sediminicola TaxID=3017783 RepID=UPI0022F007A7|nr:DsbA family protein [Paracoccus sediminicola]WBU56456.1 DsbA family protein [Paracoccus sediminicola]
MSFDLRHILSASLFSAALAMPGFAQEATTDTDAAETASEAEAGTGDAAAETAEVEPLDDIFLGDDSAPLTIYEYASFTCPHCASFHVETFPKLKAEYIDTGKVRFAQRDVYFDQVGLWAGILARCDEDKFYPVSDMLLSEQEDWMGAENGEELVENLRKIGAKAGMTSEQIDACWEDEARVERLVATFQQNATADEIQATPTFMIGGEQVPNQSWEDMKAVIEEKLADAGGSDDAEDADAGSDEGEATGSAN